MATCSAAACRSVVISCYHKQRGCTGCLTLAQFKCAMMPMRMVHMGMVHMGMVHMGTVHMRIVHMGMLHMGMWHIGILHTGLLHMGMWHMGAHAMPRRQEGMILAPCSARQDRDRDSRDASIVLAMQTKNIVQDIHVRMTVRTPLTYTTAALSYATLAHTNRWHDHHKQQRQHYQAAFWVAQPQKDN